MRSDEMSRYERREEGAMQDKRREREGKGREEGEKEREKTERMRGVCGT